MEFLRVTIIDACNLPPMDADGKADPYIEVSLRPGQKKFSTTIKPNSLNPTFNETEELPIRYSDIATTDLVLKVMDSDFPQSDELIGIIRLPEYYVTIYYDSVSLTIFHIQTPINLTKTFLLTEFCYCL